MELRSQVSVLGCKTFEIKVEDVQKNGVLYVWTGSLTCHR